MVKTEGLCIVTFVITQRNAGLDMYALFDHVNLVNSVFGVCFRGSGNPLPQSIFSTLAGFSLNSENPPMKIITRVTINNLYLCHIIINILKKWPTKNYQGHITNLLRLNLMQLLWRLVYTSTELRLETIQQ